MSEKHLVVQGATLKCKYGFTPDKLMVKTQSKRYVNDKDGKEKLLATHMDLGQTLKKNTFGNCKMQPTPGGYKPCQAVVAKWSKFYKNIKLDDNQGMALTEESLATCPIGGKDCISIVKHGQKAAVSKQNTENADEEVLAEFVPFVKFEREDDSRSKSIGKE